MGLITDLNRKTIPKEQSVLKSVIATPTMRPIIVLPTFNEKENLPLIVPAILKALPQTHILIVDDLSPDGTGEIADELSQKDARIHVLHRSGERGLGRAYLHGFQWALQKEYTHIFEMDADFSHQPQYLPLFLQAAQKADVVLGCRYMPGGGIKGWGIHRLLISKGGNFYARKVLKLPYRDLTGGFKCFHRRALEAIDFQKIRSNGYNFQIEMTWFMHQAGMRFFELPIVFPDRTNGESKMSARIFHEALLGVWQLRLNR
ncbi:MAG: polyprenol monophosphomannose synthase [Myxococcota bacterium]|nr:polyprenol monophosphomannose synthase [Myxococcota bacterium]